MNLYQAWIRISIRVGMLPEDVMRKTTWRWYKTWLAWERERWNNPMMGQDPTEHMLARVAQRVEQVLSKHPNLIRIEDQFVKFKEKKPITEADLKEKSKQGIAFWRGIFGAKGIKVKRKKSDG